MLVDRLGVGLMWSRRQLGSWKVKLRSRHMVRCLGSHPLIEISVYQTTFDWWCVSLKKPSYRGIYVLFMLIPRFHCTFAFFELANRAHSDILDST